MRFADWGLDCHWKNANIIGVTNTIIINLIGAVFMNEPKKEILLFLKNNLGERLDTAIAKATGIPLVKVHLYLSELAAINEIVSCHSIKFVKGIKSEGISCRLAGYTPPASPGRKSKSQLKLA
jgi:hypothetical protein